MLPARLGYPSFLPSLSDTLRLQASVFLRLDLAAPWGLALAKAPEVRLHVIRRGGASLGGGGLASPVELQEGEVVLLTGGREHWIADRPGRALLPSDDALSSCRAGIPPFQQGRRTHSLTCGTAGVQDRGGGWLFAPLPEVIHFRRDDLDDRVWRIIGAIHARPVSLEEDDSAVLDRLAEALFLCLLARATQLELEVGRLGAAQRDPAVRRVLVLMHAKMEEPWTIQALGDQAGISRAALARRFRSALGLPVMEYLQEIRMAGAKRLLLEGEGLGEVAARTGYASAEPFRKAFKRHSGLTPAAYLRSSR